MNPNQPAEALPWRVATLERDRDWLFRHKAESRDVEALTTKVEHLDDTKAESKDVDILAGEMRSLRRALYTFALSVVGSAIVFAFAVLQITGS